MLLARMRSGEGDQSGASDIGNPDAVVVTGAELNGKP
jgi:hypothetical protein